MADGTIEIELIIDGQKTKATLNKEVVKRSERAGKTAGKNFSLEFGKSARRGIAASATIIRSALSGVAVAAGAAVAAAGALGATTIFSSRQEDSVRALENSLRRIGEFTPEVSRDIQNFASALQETTAVGDEVVLQQIAIAQSYGATAEQSKALVAAAVDLSAAQGKDLNSNVQQLSKTLGGYAGELGEVIPQLKGLTQEQLRNGAAVELLGKQYEGFAAAQATTFSGAFKNLGNAFFDLLENIGSLISQTPIFSALIVATTQTFQKFGKAIKENSEEIRSFITNGIRTFISSLKILISSFQVVREQLFGSTGFQILTRQLASATAGVNILATAFRILARTGAVVFSGLQQVIAGTINIFFQAGKAVGLVSDEVAAATSATVRQIEGETKAAFDSLFSEDTIVRGKGFAEALAETLTGITGQVIDPNTGENALGSLFDSFSEENLNALVARFENATNDLQNKVKETTGVVKKEVNAFGQALSGGALNSITAIFNQLGKTLAGAGDGFEGFLGVALDALGNLAIAIGTTVAGSAKAIEALKLAVQPKFGSGAGAIIAGGALIAVGSALKVFASSFGGSSSSAQTTGGGSGATGSTDGTAATTDFNTDLEDSEDRQLARNVSVVVQGDLLNTGQETAQRIVELLNDNFEAEGSTLFNVRTA